MGFRVEGVQSHMGPLFFGGLKFVDRLYGLG